MYSLIRNSALVGLALVFVAGCQQSSTTQTGAKQLTVTTAQDQTIKQGDTDKVKVSIDRKNFEDPVTVTLKLPPGIETAQNDVVIPANATSTTFELKAKPDAPLGEHNVEIDAKAPGVTENSQSFKLTVKD